MTRKRPSIPPPELIARCVTSPDEAALTLLEEQFGAHVFKVLEFSQQCERARAGLDIESEDLCGEVWYKLLRKDCAALRTFRGSTEAQFRAFLTKIAYRALIDRVRRELRQRRPRIAHNLTPEEQEAAIERFPSADASPLELAERGELSRRFRPVLRAAWRSSPTRDRDIRICDLALRDGWSAHQIAAALGTLSRGGVEKVVLRGRRALRRGFGLDRRGAS